MKKSERRAIPNFQLVEVDFLVIGLRIRVMKIGTNMLKRCRRSIYVPRVDSCLALNA